MELQGVKFPKNPNLLEELEQVFKTKRLEVVKPNGVLITPLEVLKQLASKHKVGMHMETYVVYVGAMEGTDRLYRVEILCGQHRGLGQSPINGLTFQLAAANMLEKLKASDPSLDLGVYGIPPGSRIHPHILKDLVHLCQKNKLANPHLLIIKSDKPFEEQEMYDCIVTVGPHVTAGRSDSQFMARRLACRNMFNAISKIPYPEMPLAMGGDCIGLLNFWKMGLQPVISVFKEKWWHEHRMKDGKIVKVDDEPEDGYEFIRTAGISEFERGSQMVGEEDEVGVEHRFGNLNIQ